MAFFMTGFEDQLKLFLEMSGIDLAQHAGVAMGIIFAVNFLKKKLFGESKLRKYTPVLAFVLAMAYFLTPLAGLAEGTTIGTKVIAGVVFGMSLIGGRTSVKSIKGDYDDEGEESAEEPVEEE